jgi:hypothetical protein
LWSNRANDLSACEFQYFHKQMNSRRTFLTTIALLAVRAASAQAANTDHSPKTPQGGKSAGRLTGVRSITVEELARDREGSQGRSVGCQIVFNASVLVGGTDSRMHIDGTGDLGIATIHNTPKDFVLLPNQKVRIRGLIVDQWYGVWQIWCYEIKKAV